MEHIKPTVGRIVHFRPWDSADVYPGIVTEVHEGGVDDITRVDLVTFGRGSIHFHENIPQQTPGDPKVAPGIIDGCWFWPPRA